MNIAVTRARKPAVIIGAVLLLLFVLPMAAWAQTDINPEFLGYMADIAEDMEEIHHDMHKVAFGIRLGSYSLVVVAVASVLMLGTMIVQGKRRD